MKAKVKTIDAKAKENLLQALQVRFEKNMHRHKELKWTDVLKKLQKNEQALWSLNEMEKTGGEPDVTHYDSAADCFVFTDCSAESPAPRRSLCYDQQALDSRKENKPKGSAIDMAAAMGIRLLSETEYKQLQELEDFDRKTSSWLLTPEPIRKLGGAIFGDKRYNTTFVYHNGAESYYAARGFRGRIEVG